MLKTQKDWYFKSCLPRLFSCNFKAISTSMMDISTYMLTCLFMVLLQGLQVSQGQYDSYWDPNNISPEELLPPSFRDTPNKTEVRQGETAVLRCAIDNLGTKKVTWRKSTELNPMFIQKHSFSSDTRYRVEHEPLQPDWNLIIEQVNKSDEGLYICQISSKKSMLKFVFLKVQKGYVTSTDGKRKISGRSHSHSAQEKIIPDFRYSEDQILDKGKKLSLFCNEVTDTDEMADSIDWFLDGTKLTSDSSKGLIIKKKIAIMKRNISSTLEIESVQMSDSGTYICRSGNNRLGRVRVDVLNADSSNFKRGTERNSNQGKYAIAKSRHDRYDEIDNKKEEETNPRNHCSQHVIRPANLSFLLFAACLLHRYLIYRYL